MGTFVVTRLCLIEPLLVLAFESMSASPSGLMLGLLSIVRLLIRRSWLWVVCAVVTVRFNNLCLLCLSRVWDVLASVRTVLVGSAAVAVLMLVLSCVGLT